MKKYISVIILLIIAIISQTVYAQNEYSTIKAKVIKRHMSYRRVLCFWLNISSLILTKT